MGESGLHLVDLTVFCSTTQMSHIANIHKFLVFASRGSYWGWWTGGEVFLPGYPFVNKTNKIPVKYMILGFLDV